MTERISARVPVKGSGAVHVVPASCGLAGKLVEDGDIGIYVPPAGAGIAGAASGDEDSEQFAIEVDDLGNVFLLFVGSEGAGMPEEPVEAGYPGACRDSENLMNSEENDIKEWMYVWETTPANLTGVDTLEALRKAHDNITNRHNDCDHLDRGDTDAEWAYAGGTNRVSNLSGDGDCDGWFSRDHTNVLDFRNVTSKFLGFTCWWYWTGSGEITEADVRFSDSKPWTLHPHDGSCSSDWDLESVATHEVGHSYGLLHVREHRGHDLTMSENLEATCEISERTLGLGDWMAMTSSY